MTNSSTCCMSTGLRKPCAFSVRCSLKAITCSPSSPAGSSKQIGMPTSSQSQPTLHTSSRMECTSETSKPVLNLFEGQTRTSWWSSLTTAARRLSSNSCLSAAIVAFIWESSVVRHLAMSSLITGTVADKASCNKAMAILASCPREGLARNGPRDYSRRGGPGLELVRERTRELVRESCSLRLETKGCGYCYELIISTNRRRIQPMMVTSVWESNSHIIENAAHVTPITAAMLYHLHIF